MILSILVLSIIIIYFSSLQEEKKQVITTDNNTLKIDNSIIKYIQEPIPKNPKLLAKNLVELSPSNYQYILSSDNLLNINISDNNLKAIKYVAK